MKDELIIMQRFRQGDEQAFKRIFDEYSRGWQYDAYGFTHNKDVAEDVVADCCIKLWEKRKEFELLNNIRAFMTVAIRNKCLDHINSIKRKDGFHRDMVYSLEKESDYIEAQIIKSDLLKAVMDETKQLTAIEQNIFQLIFVKDFSSQEIADYLGLSVNTIRVQKARILQKLKSRVLRLGL